MKAYLPVVLSSILLSTSIQAKSLDAVFSSTRAPYIFVEDNRLSGIEVDIVTAALAEKGHSLKKALSVPSRRLKNAVVKSGKDLAVSVKQASDGTFYSDPFISFSNYAISKKKSQITLDNLHDLTKYTVVAWQLASVHLGENFSELFAKESLDDSHSYTEYTNQETQNIVFWHDRVDVILVDKNIFLWYKKKLASSYDTSQALTYHDILGEANHMRVSFKEAEIRDDFNQGLKSIKADGRYTKIIEKYTK